MTSTSIEREEKWDVPAGFTLPSLAELLPAGTTLTTERVRLSSTYFDTRERDLLRADVSLRRRTGDTDTGWQAKLNSRTGRRTEIAHPLAAGASSEPVAAHRSTVDAEPAAAPTTDISPPPELTARLAGLSRGRDLRPIAILNTERTVVTVRDSDGQELLEVADDLVHSTALGDSAQAQSWREIEVELRGGSEQLLRRLARRLDAAGALRLGGSSKLARALSIGSRAARSTDPIAAYLDAQYAALVSGDLALRTDQEALAAVHPTRVACRRLRSTLRVFGAVLDELAPGYDALDGELAWYAAALGQVRDVQVMRSHFETAVGAVPPELALGPVRARIARDLDRREREGIQTLDQVMNSSRYFALLDATEQLRRRVARRTPTSTKRVRRHERSIAQSVSAANRKWEKRLRQAVRAPADDALLHRARKAAKRARYAYEAAGGPGSKRRVRAFKDRQSELGDFQDSVVAKQLLRTWATATASQPDENGFTFGLLWQRETDAQQRIRAGLQHAH